jgi:hypothetical protein
VDGAVLSADRFSNTSYAYYFDGIDDHIDVPYDSSFYPPSLGVAVWVNVTSFPDTGACYILTTSGDKQTPPYDPFRLRVNSQRQVFVRFEGDTDSVHINMFSTTQLNAGGWYFIVAYYDNLLGRGALYINNVKEDSTDRPMALDKNAIGLRIGAAQTHNGNLTENEFFNGIIDDIRIYNRAISGERIAELYDEVVGIETEKPALIDRLILYQNYPNPFNPSTTLKFYLPTASPVEVKIFDLSGRWVRSLMNDFRAAGEHTLLWDGNNHQGNPVSSGIYIYNLEASGKIYRKKMILLK